MIIEEWLCVALIKEYQVNHNGILPNDVDHAVLDHIAANNLIFYQGNSAVLIEKASPYFHVYSKKTHPNIRKLVYDAQQQTRFYHGVDDVFVKIHNKNSIAILLAVLLGMTTVNHEGDYDIFLSNIEYPRREK